MNDTSLENHGGGGPEDQTRLHPMETAYLSAALDEHAMVSITDRRGRIIHINDKFCEISQYSHEELLGQDHRIINSGHHSKEFMRGLWRALAAGDVWEGEVKNRAKDGSHFWVATTIVPFPGEEATPRQLVAVRTDITERKRLEKELAEKLRLQQLLAELSARFVGLPPEQVDAAIEDTQRLIVKGFALDRSTLWQETDQQLVLTHYWQESGWPEVPGPIAAAQFFPWLSARLQRGEFFSFSSVSELPPEAGRDAESFRLFGMKSHICIPLFASGRVFGVLSFAAMRTERRWREDEIAELKLVAQIFATVLGRKRAEEHAEQLRAELAHSSRVATLGELVAALAHELNQPLAGILSNAQAARRFLAEGTVDPEELRATFDDIIRDDKRAGAVIHNLRAMLTKRPVVRETCSLNELVCEVLELLHAELLGEHVEVRTTLASDLPRVAAARVELQQVLVNFLLNAEQAMKETPHAQRRIDIETESRSGNVRISVRDHGCGIPPERLAEVFAPFYTTKAHGLGMGLCICRRIVENHGGRIETCNHAEGGAIFSILLPATE
ncbi:MAG: Multi-sensor signal transduction histidine kinase [Chthoniobacteraceae bacterium]|nr:Multi-sensor signal transduction histidine kinase [Chthoniobacteraceae bacterium]